MEKPVFVYGKRGQSFTTAATEWTRIATNSREEFEKWVWDLIQVEIIFVNEHDHPVEVYWIHGRRANVKMTLQPGEEVEHTTKLSHEWWIRDARTDTHRDSPGRWKLTDNSMLASWKITSDEHSQRLVIPRRTCFDLSGHCAWWHSHGECKKNPGFMQEQCAKTCETCTETDEKSGNMDGDQEGHDEF